MAEKHPREALIQLFSSKLIIELQDMKTALEGVSAMTVFRYLKQISYRRSYNHNGRYYTLYKPSKFDRCGIWNKGDILFSVDGSLLNTVRRFVHESDAGATHRELQDILKIRVHNALAELTRKGQVERERLTAVFVYLHSDPTVKEKGVVTHNKRESHPIVRSKRGVNGDFRCFQRESAGGSGGFASDSGVDQLDEEFPQIWEFGSNRHKK
jgi:hypothetical protein